MSYRKIISTFPTRLNKYKKNIFAVREDINEIFSNNNFVIESLSNSTGSLNILHITSSLSVLGEVNSSTDYHLNNNLKISNSQLITLNKNNNIQVDAGNVNFNEIKAKNNFLGKEITGSLEYIDKERSTKYIVQGEGISVDFNSTSKQFECSRKNESISTGESTSLVFTCDPNSANTNSIFVNHYVAHDTNDNGVDNNNKYNIRSNLGTDPMYCTNTVILQPGYHSIDEDDPLIRAITSSTKQIFEFKNLDVMPGWTTGSNSVIGNGDIYWPVTIDDDVKKSSQTIILDFSKMLEENVLLPGKSIQIKWDDNYRVETTYPILMKKNGGQYHFPSGSTSFGDDEAANCYQGNNEHSYYLGKCTFDKDDLEGTSAGEDDLSTISSDSNPITEVGSLKELSPFYYLEGLNTINYLIKHKGYGSFFNAHAGGELVPAKTKFSTSSTAKRHIQTSNISISTFKPRLMLGLGENSIIYKDDSIDGIKHRFLEVSSSFKVTTSPPVLAKFESANNYRFFNTYDENILGGEKVHPIILHKVFPDVLPENDGSYFKNTKISFSEISDFLNTRTDSENSFFDANVTPTNMFNVSQFKYSGFATYTILSSSFYYDLKNDSVLNNFCKNLHTSQTWSQLSRDDDYQRFGFHAFTNNLKIHIPYVGLKEKTSSRSHDLGSAIKTKYHNLFYDFQIPTNFSELFSHGTHRAWPNTYSVQTACNTMPSKFVSNIKNDSSHVLLTYPGINSNMPTNINNRSFSQYTISRYTENGIDLFGGRRFSAITVPEIDDPLNIGISFTSTGPHPLGIWIDGTNQNNNILNARGINRAGIFGRTRVKEVNEPIVRNFANPNIFSKGQDIYENKLLGSKVQALFFQGQSLPLLVMPCGNLNSSGNEIYETSASSVNNYRNQDNHHITYNDVFYNFIPKLLPQDSGKNSIELMYIGLDASNRHQWIILGVG